MASLIPGKWYRITFASRPESGAGGLVGRYTHAGPLVGHNENAHFFDKLKSVNPDRSLSPLPPPANFFMLDSAL